MLIHTLKQDKNKEHKIIFEKIDIKKEFKLENIIPCNFDNRMLFLKEEFNITKNLPINAKIKKNLSTVKPVEKETVSVSTVQTQVLDELEESKIVTTSTNLINFDNTDSENKKDLKSEEKNESAIEEKNNMGDINENESKNEEKI